MTAIPEPASATVPHPRCPRCHSPVAEVVQHRVIPRGRAWLELRPCGHETTAREYQPAERP